MTDAPPPRVRPSWPTIGVFLAIGATLFLAGVRGVQTIWNSWDFGTGILVSAAGVLMLLIGIILLMIRAVRAGMRRSSG